MNRTGQNENGTKHFKHLLLSMLVVLALFPLAAGQNQAETETEKQPSRRNIHQWGAIGLFHGLPSDRVYAIAQAGDGVIWFGTERGLARYDGRRVQTVVAENLPAVRVSALKFADDGALWVGTQTGAVRIVKNQFQRVEKTAGKEISRILFADGGSVFLASAQGQIFECLAQGENNLQTREIPDAPLTAADNEPDKMLPVTSLAVHNGVLLAGSRRRGLLHLTAGGTELGEVMSRPRPFFINALAKDKNGNLWLGADAGRDESGLYLAANDVYRLEKIGAGVGTATDLAFDQNGDLWVGTAERGAFHFRGREQIENFTFENTAGGLRSNNVFTVFVDRESVVWFGTDRGAFRYDPNAPRSEPVADNAQSNFVRALFQMRAGRVFAGTNRGLFSVGNWGERWHENRNFVGETIFGVAETGDGQLLVGTASGLFVNGALQSRSSDAKQAAESVRAIRQFQNQIYLANFGRGVERVEPGGSRTIIFPPANAAPDLREVTSLYQENNRKLWIGTARRGVFLFDGKSFSQDARLEKLKDGAVRAIDGDETGGIWFATENGLFLWRNGKIENVLPDAPARSVYLEPGGSNQQSVWTATSKGLFHVRFDQEFGWLTSRLEVEQGLPSQNIFAVLPEQNGNLIVGTNRGIVRYQANRVQPLVIPTRILSRRLHEAAELAGGIRLDYPQNSLALEVAGQSSRTFPEQFQYAFVLRDRAGNVLKKKLSPDAQFLMENLKAGDYAVEARAFDKDLQSSAPLVFNFTVERAPFPWTATTLGVLLGLTLVALVLVVLQRNKIWRTNRQLANARLDLANEAERERRRIARDLHDQTLADLRHLLMLTDKFENGAASEAGKFRGEIENVSREVRRICEDLSPSVLENIGLAAALEWAGQQIAAESNFEFEFAANDDFEENLRLAPSAQIQIYRIAQEVLHNIGRHAAASRVRLALENADRFVLIVENDGRGFDPANKSNKQGRGVRNIAARAALVEAEIEWREQNGKTIFALRRANAVDSHTI